MTVMSNHGSIPNAPSPGPFLILIDGLPASYTWKELKDLIRPVANTGVWTDIPVLVEPTLTPAKKGYIRLKLWKEAYMAYVFIYRSKDLSWALHVELHDVHTSPPQVIYRSYQVERGNPITYERDVARVIQNAAAWQPSLSPTSAVPYSNSYPQPSMVQCSSVQPPMQTGNLYGTPITAPYRYQYEVGLINLQAQQAQVQQAQYQQALAHHAAQQQAGQSHAYATVAGLPVNLQHGATVTENRSVFVRDISFKANAPDLKTYFGKAGTIVNSTIQVDKNGKFKGNAIFQYASAEEAKRAVEHLHNTPFLGRPLDVRFDKNKHVVSEPRKPNSGPVIANGSNGGSSR